MAQVLRGTMAELMGTAVMVYMMDNIIISSAKSDIGNLAMAILLGLTLAIILITLFPISGGHINPAISLSAALLGHISLSRAFMYILAQCVGAAFGALSLKAVISTEDADHFSLVGCTITEIKPGPDGPVKIGLGLAQAFWLETFFTFSVLLTALGIAFNPRLMKSFGAGLVFPIIGLIVALVIFASTTVTGQKGYAGVGLNPARCFGAALVRGGHLWDGHWIFWIGPLIACFGFYFYSKAVIDEESQAQVRKHDFLGLIKALIRR
ncbi:OLC1v1003408C2 [Oldenlandia corymbosa var. corymbosa]|uniref:OLC1v1003408C2 n=1 Tax=Oldenlandia corymbosa var. corymbosa TaxID=529605 RepID=A0AAV1DCS6_OLDCO|nr:OLC1v1003408C2 [Oldenlandia corymbosa var. corymbosa]